MKEKSLGFIGGGRVTTCILNGLRRAGRLSSSVTVSDENRDTLDRLKSRFPEIELAPGNNGKAASKDIVFLALHPPALREGLGLGVAFGVLIVLMTLYKIYTIL